MNLLEIKELSKSFCKKKRVRDILKNLNAEFRGGEVVAIMGPSGCGKSTLLNILGGIMAPDKIKNSHIAKISVLLKLFEILSVYRQQMRV